MTERSAEVSVVDPLDVLAEEFVHRLRDGEHPPISEYTARHPELAERIRSLFPTLLEMEQAGWEVGPARPGAPVAGRIGEFRILRKLGEGGMGVVYEAVQESLGRHVALKVLSHHRDATYLERFRREARTAARLHHTNIVPVFAVGEAEGAHYYAMQFIHGQGLDSVLREVRALRQPGPAPAPEPSALAATVAQSLHDGEFTTVAIDAAESDQSAQRVPRSDLAGRSEMLYYREVSRLGAQAAEALAYAHGQGVLHRDIKPSNLLIDTQGTLWITDFGLAKADDSDDLTHTGDLVGTLRYMAPERLCGEADGRSDVYALGATLYEMLALCPAFTDAGRVELLDRIARDTPPPLRRQDPRIPRDLETIVLKTMARDPADRYRSAAELAEDLHRFFSDRPIRARRASPAEELWRWARRNRLVAGLAASVVLLLILFAVGASVAAFRMGRARDQARAAEHHATDRLFHSLLARAQAARRGGQIGQRFDALHDLDEAVRTARTLGVLNEHLVTLRTETAACLALADLRVADEWPSPTQWDRTMTNAVACDSHLQTYAFGGPDGQVHILRRGSGSEVVARLAGRGAATDVGFGASGRFLAVVHRPLASLPHLILWELRPGEGARKAWTADDTGLFAFSPDGRLLAAGPENGPITVRDLATGREQRFTGVRAYRCLAFDPDGHRLAFPEFQDATRVNILNISTGNLIGHLAHPDDIKALAWSPDGRLLAAGCDDRNVHVWDMMRQYPQAVLQGHQKWVIALAFSPTGRLLASAAVDGTTRLWDPISGRELVSAPGSCLAFSADGRQLGFRHDERAGAWEVADDGEFRVMHHGRVGNRAPWQHCKGPEALDFRPDGTLLASAARDGVRLWDVASGSEAGYLNSGHHEAVAFDPTGQQLYTFGRTGLRSWPIRAATPDAGALRVGPPELVTTGAVAGWFRGARSEHGDWIAAADHVSEQLDRIIVFRGARPKERTVLKNASKISSLALSPDGRWTAAGLMEQAWAVQVWDSRTGAPVWSFPGQYTKVAFSPDGCWLVGGSPADYRAWRTGSWEPGPVMPRDRREDWAGPLAFRPDGQVLAVASSLQHVSLLDFRTGREVVRLAGKYAPCVECLSFSPDGRLLAVGTEAHSVQLWDLAAVGRRLDVTGIGSALIPALPSSPNAGTPPLRAHVVQIVQEVEHLLVLASPGADAIWQDMAPWGRERWSNGEQLLCLTAQGGFVELAVAPAAAGRYRLEVGLTLATNYGLVAIALDGRPIGPTINGYSEAVRPSEPVDCGVLDLGAGPHRLRFTAVDKDPRSTGYLMGVDFVRLTPAEPEGDPRTIPGTPK